MSDAYLEVNGLMVIYSKLAGVSFDDRQDNISQCKDCDKLDLMREPNNTYDKNAIRVEDKGRMLGYIPKVQAASLAQYMDAGGDIAGCYIDRIIGGGTLNYGVTISIMVKDNYQA